MSWVSSEDPHHVSSEDPHHQRRPSKGEWTRSPRSSKIEKIDSSASRKRSKAYRLPRSGKIRLSPRGCLWRASPRSASTAVRLHAKPRRDDEPADEGRIRLRRCWGELAAQGRPLSSPVGACCLDVATISRTV